jgi:mRNA export factor
MVNVPFFCSGYNRNGAIFAYALSYDWSRGYAEYNPQVMKNTILLHSMKEDEVKPKSKLSK